MNMTLENFIDRLDADLAWRRKELSHFKIEIEKTHTAKPSHLPTLRAGIALLYAHYEGFIKFSSDCYIQYVAQRRLTHSELTYNFVSMSLFNIPAEQSGNKYIDTMRILRSYAEHQGKRASISSRFTVSTKSNLNYSGLMEIAALLGITPDSAICDSDIIDKQLLRWRNEIAHGGYTELDVTHYSGFRDKVMRIIEHWHEILIEAAGSKKYLASQRRLGAPGGSHATQRA